MSSPGRGAWSKPWRGDPEKTLGASKAGCPPSWGTEQALGEVEVLTRDAEIGQERPHVTVRWVSDGAGKTAWKAT